MSQSDSTDARTTALQGFRGGTGPGCHSTAFDFVITVALGSTLATLLLSSSVSLVDGVFALALLVGLQWVVAFASARSRWVERLVKAEPTLLYRDGLLQSAMRKQRVTADELRQASRASGHADLDELAAIILGTDGTLSILTSQPSTLQGPPDPESDGS